MDGAINSSGAPSRRFSSRSSTSLAVSRSALRKRHDDERGVATLSPFFRSVTPVSQIPALVTSSGGGHHHPRNFKERSGPGTGDGSCCSYPRALTILCRDGGAGITCSRSADAFLSMAVITGLFSHSLHKTASPTIASIRLRLADTVLQQSELAAPRRKPNKARDKETAYA